MATKRKDFTQVAFDVVQRATGGQTTAPAPSKKQERGRKVKANKPKPASVKR